MTWGGRRRIARVALLTATVAVAACAVVPPIDGTGTAADTLSGRMAVRVEAADGARAVSAAFELRGNAEAGSLNLATPLGTVLAQARWSQGLVALATPQGERRFADLDALTREVLGEALPLAALFDWLRGRPWPGAASSATVPPAEAGFEQLGWVVNLARFDESWVSARRERPLPPVTVRARMDSP